MSEAEGRPQAPRSRAGGTVGLPGARGHAADVRDAVSVRAAAEAIRADLDTNLKGPFLTCREFLPGMIEAHDGCIVNIASTAGVRGGRRRAAYCASKGGLVQLTRSLAIDHGPDGVRVNCLCPGLIDTEMADWIRQDEEALERWAATIPARRIGTAREIADGVAYLASDGASYLYGAVLAADGGVTA